MATSPAQDCGNGPIRICLYCCIPERKEDKPLQLPGLRRAKRIVRRRLDDIALRVSGRLIARFYDYNDTTGSNRGDIALRQQVRALIASALAPREIVWTEIGWGDLTVEGIRKINEECDLFLIGGGGYIHFGLADSIPARARAFEDDVEQLARLTIPVVAFAIGANLIFSESNQTLEISDSSKHALRAFYSKAASTSVRGSVTASALTQVGVAKTVPLVPDPVLYLQSRSSQQPVAQDSVRIGLNLAFSGHMTQELLHKAIHPIARAISQCARQHKATVLYFVHESSERGIPGWLRHFGIDCEVVDAGPSELADAYATLTLHVGSMMHSTILAMAQNVPTIGLAYGTKHVGLFDVMQQNERLLVLPEIRSEELIAKINDTLANRNLIATRIAERRAALRPALDAAVEDIANLVRKGCGQTVQSPLFKAVGVG